jgi:AcrR family transcriptional regulator
MDADVVASPRQRLLDTALRLFYSEGLNVGIDRIIAEAGVAKASFYKHFPSKDDLIVAFLRQRHENWMKWFAARLEQLAFQRKPRMKLVAEVLREWFEEPGFRGCAFINAMASGGLAGEAVSVAQSHKDELLDCLRALAGRAGLKAPGELAEEALLIVEGAIVRAHMTGDPGVAKVAARALARLDVQDR